MAKKGQVEVDEAMMRGIMMKEVPVYDGGHSRAAVETPLPMGDPVPGTGVPQGLPRTEARRQHGNKKKNEGGPEEGYAARFLVNDHSRDRVSANISRGLFERIRKFLPVVAPDITLTSYLNNIISEHLETHWDEIYGLYHSELEKPL